MSINHFSSDLPEAHWWSRYVMLSSSSSSNIFSPSSSLSPHTPTPTFWLPPSPPPPMLPFDLNHHHDDEDDHCLHEQHPKDRLFEKPLTPSDVGKLNRLVIPKQHAEKHFPLNDSGENGLLLGFEDELGKSWRFRYSYWNSSQSYVLTKGWSRFVKEKRLDAGDVVVFARHRADAGRLFIGWRRRRNPQDGGVAQGMYSGQQQGQGRASISLSYQQPQNVDADTGRRSGNGNSKRLRLFGVNMECQAADGSEASTPMSRQQAYYQEQQYDDHQHHMDMSFSGGAADVYRQG